MFWLTTRRVNLNMQVYGNVSVFIYESVQKQFNAKIHQKGAKPSTTIVV